MRGTTGAELDPALDEEHVDAVVDKGNRPDAEGYSAFEPAELSSPIREEAVTALTVAGRATEYCVAATARDALREGFAVTVDRSATRAVDAAEGDGERAFAELRSLGAEVVGLSKAPPGSG